MEQNLLLDAIERYHKGEMGREEKIYFEDLRKTNPDIDQKVVEQIILLDQLEHLSNIERLRQTMNIVEDKLELEGAIQFRKKDFKAKVVYIWKRYRRTISVAAAAAGIVSLLTATGVSFISGNKKNSELTPLVDNKLHQMEHKLNQMESKLKDVATVKPVFEANFRATGFLADGRGYIITNAHVVNKARNLIVENNRGDQFSAKALYSDPVTDLAILKITDSSFKRVNSIPYTFQKEKTELAEQIFTLGFPREEIVYNEGYLSAKSGYYGDTTTYQVSIAVNPGNSGGPVLNKYGDVIGVISSKETNSDGVVFAVQSKNIFRAIRQIREKDGDTIKLPNHNGMRNLSRVQQIKAMEDYVYKVKGN